MFHVYSCGSNGRFQLGNGTDEDLNQLERVFDSNIRPVKIACGGNHTLILLEDGEIYASGDNTFGQCGIETKHIAGAETHIQCFTKIPNIGGIPWVDCSAGYEFSIFVNANQEIYSSGFGLKGELGQGEKISKALSLGRVAIETVAKVKELRSCLDHTVVLLEDNQVFGWGNGRSGKLGQPAPSKIWTPRQIGTELNVTDVEVGRDFTVLGDLGTGSIELIGKDKFGITSQAPKYWKSFKTMWSSVHFLDSSGEIKSVGNDSHGQLVPEKSLKYDLFQVGSEHGIVKVGQEVKSWGWGEHGNCGINKTDSVTFDYVNQLHLFPKDESILSIYGGCATTWVVTKNE